MLDGIASVTGSTQVGLSTCPGSGPDQLRPIAYMSLLLALLLSIYDRLLCLLRRHKLRIGEHDVRCQGHLAHKGEGAACDSTDSYDGTIVWRRWQFRGTSGGGGSNFKGTSPSDSTVPKNTSTQPSVSDTTIVAYEVKKERSNSPHNIDVTFTNQDGESETIRQATLPWTGGTFVPVGGVVSLTGETSTVENALFSCTVRLNGLRHVSGSQAVTEGNDIVGFKCHVGPLTAKSFP
jgi:hypothetical protein